MYRLKDLDIRIPARGHVIKAAAADLLDEASHIIADAESRSAEIVAAANARYEEERERGYRDGLERAEGETVARLLEEQAVLDRCLAAIDGELASIAMACVRQLIGVYGDSELAQTYIANAIRRMRRQKRIRLGVSSRHYQAIRDNVDAVLRDFPEIELIDVSENPALGDLQFVLESEVGRIEGSVERGLSDIEERLRAVLRQHIGQLGAEASEPPAEGEAAP